MTHKEIYVVKTVEDGTCLATWLKIGETIIDVLTINQRGESAPVEVTSLAQSDADFKNKQPVEIRLVARGSGRLGDDSWDEGGAKNVVLEALREFWSEYHVDWRILKINYEAAPTDDFDKSFLVAEL